jgi:hypothetical protein
MQEREEKEEKKFERGRSAIRMGRRANWEWTRLGGRG